MTIIPIRRDVLIRALELAVEGVEVPSTKGRKQVLKHLQNSCEPMVASHIMVDLQDFAYFGLDKFAPDEPVSLVGLAPTEQG